VSGIPVLLLACDNGRALQQRCYANDTVPLPSRSARAACARGCRITPLGHRPTCPCPRPRDHRLACNLANRSKVPRMRRLWRAAARDRSADLPDAPNVTLHGTWLIANGEAGASCRRLDSLLTGHRRRR
jgi:hypothetical protein